MVEFPGVKYYWKVMEQEMSKIVNHDALKKFWSFVHVFLTRKDQILGIDSEVSIFDILFTYFCSRKEQILGSDSEVSIFEILFT